LPNTTGRNGPRPKLVSGPKPQTGHVPSSRCQTPAGAPRAARESKNPLRTPAAAQPAWWSQTGSNRRPQACKARALPTELWPLRRVAKGRQTIRHSPFATPRMVGLGRLERPTSPLSGVRSNHLSYRPGRRPESQAREAKLETGARSGKTIEGKRRRRRSARRGPTRPRDDPKRSKKTGRGRSCGIILRKEVIQPQVPLRLPCYDFTPVADPTVVACP
jgi:hypothetical protein